MKKFLRCLLAVIFAVSMLAVCAFQSGAEDIQHQYTDESGNVYTYTVVNNNAYINNIEIKSSGTHLTVSNKIEGYPVERILGISPETCKNLSELTLIGSNLRYIGENVFTGCENLKAVHFNKVSPSSCIIGNNAFCNLKSLETVTFNDVNGMTLGENAFADCNNLKNIDFGTSGVFTIKDGCFKGAAITEITIPKSPNVYLGRYVFSECKSLVKADIYAYPLNRTIYTIDGKEDKSVFKNYEYSQGLFSGCTALQEVKIANYSKIYDGMFENCSSLKKYDIGSAEEIGAAAFSGCSSLEDFDFSKISKINSGSFKGCSSFKSIDISKFKEIPASCFKNCSSLTELDLTGVEKVGNYAFAGCTGLKSITIDHNITFSGHIFEDCSGLEEVIIGDDVSWVNNQGQRDFFKGCTNIKYIYIGKSLLPTYKRRNDKKNYLGTDFFGFGDLSGLEIIEVSPDNPYYSVVDGALYLDEGEYYILLCYPAAKKGTYFSTEKALANVSKDFTIGEYAFAGNKYLKEVNFTKSVVYPDFEYDGWGERCYKLLSYCFAGSAVEKVTFPEGGIDTVGPHMFEDSAIKDIDLSNTKVILEYAFSGCTTFTELNLPSCIEIRKYAFQNCTSLKSVNLPVWVENDCEDYASGYVFAYCTALETVNMPLAIQIDAGMFYGCTSLEKVNATVEYVGKDAFNGCSKLQGISLKDAYICENAFLNCTSLKNIKLYGVSTIKDNAFKGCTSLYLAQFDNTRCKFGVGVFEGCPKLSFYCDENCDAYNYAVENNIPVIAVSVGFQKNTYEYTGSEIQPSIIVSIGDMVLVQNKDYILIFENNTDVGKANVTVRFIGDFDGLPDAHRVFNIVCINLKNATVQYDKEYYYNGEAVELDVTVTLNGKTLVRGVDYSVYQYASDTDIGTKRFRVYGIGNYTGLIECSYTVVLRDISEAVIEYTKDNIYEGEEIKPTVVIKMDGKTLTEGVDYDIVYVSGADTDTRYFTVKGKGNYTGAIDCFYNIIRRDISNAVVEYVKDNVYEGEDIRPAVVINLDGEILTEDVDYKIIYQSGVDTGTMIFTVKGIGKYIGSIDCYYNIIRRDIAEAEVQKIQDYVYTGDEICPLPVIEWNGFTLVNGEDFEVRYFENVNAGFGTAVIYGKGNFCGTQRVKFRIFGKGVENAVVSEIPDMAYNGDEIRPEITVTVDGVALKEGTDYTVEYINNTEQGTAEVIISGIGNYSGVIRKTFEIYKNSVNAFTVFSDKEDLIYSGSELKPEIEVYFNGELLSEGVDYEISITDNISAGTANVTVIGIGRFEGERTYTFTIQPCGISEKDISVSGKLEFTGTPVEPVITVTKDGKILENGKDYTVTYYDNDRVGTAYATVEGIGNYCGSINLEYEIYKNEDKKPEPQKPDEPEQNEPSKDNTDSETSNKNDNVNHNGTQNGDNKPQTPPTDANKPSEVNNGSAVQIPNTDEKTDITSVWFIAAISMLFALFAPRKKRKIKD